MPASKNILISSALYAPHVGGVEKYTEALARQLTTMGHRVYVVTYQLADDHPIQESIDGVCVVRLPCGGFMNYRYPLPRKNARYKSQIRWLESLPFDAIIVNTRFYLLSHEICAFAQRKGLRPIVIEHGSAHLALNNTATDIAVAQAEHALTKSLTLKAACADYYGVSQVCNRWLQHFGISSKGILPNAIDAESFRALKSDRDFRAEQGIDRNAFLVCYIGRFNKEKGILSLLDAAKLLSRRDNIHFIFAGTGPLLENVTSCELPTVHFVGALPACDVSALLQSANAFCLPSRSEGFSTALLEAAACGATPLVTKVGGVEELIPSDLYGVILRGAKPRHIARKILALSKKRARCTRMGAALAERTSRCCSWERTALAVLDAIEDARPMTDYANGPVQSTADCASNATRTPTDYATDSVQVALNSAADAAPMACAGK